MKKVLILIMLIFNLIVIEDVFAISYTFDFESKTNNQSNFTNNLKGHVQVIIRMDNDLNSEYDVKGLDDFSNFSFDISGDSINMLNNIRDIELNSKISNNSFTNKSNSSLYMSCFPNEGYCSIAKNTQLYDYELNLTNLGTSDDSGNIKTKTNNNNNNNNNGASTLQFDFSMLLNGVNDSCAFFGSKNDEKSIVGMLEKYVFTPIRFIVPILFILLTSYDFAKAIFMDEKNGSAKARNNIWKRGLVTVILFFIPTIIEVLLSLLDIVNCF